MKRFPSLAVLLLVALPLACASPDASSQEAAEAETSAVPPGLFPATGETAETTPLGTAPDFTLPTLAGDSLRLADLRGRVVLINFWATWCGPCVEEIPELVDLYKELGPQGLTVVGIALDEEGEDIVAPFADRFNISYPVALDDGTVADRFGGVWALPTTYVIGRDGTILERVIGLFPVAEKRAALRAMLAEAPVKNTAHE